MTSYDVDFYRFCQSSVYICILLLSTHYSNDKLLTQIMSQLIHDCIALSMLPRRHLPNITFLDYYSSPSAADNTVSLAVGFLLSSSATVGSSFAPTIVVDVDNTEMYSGTANFNSEALSITSSVRFPLPYFPPSSTPSSNFLPHKRRSV